MIASIFAAAALNLCPALTDFAQQQLDNQRAIEANDIRLYGHLQAATIDARQGFVSAARHVREVCPGYAALPFGSVGVLALEYPPCGTPEAKRAGVCTKWTLQPRAK